MNKEMNPDMPEKASAEAPPEIVKSGEESFREIEALIAEGWKLKGNDFQENQTWRSVVSKSGEEDKVFYTTKAYPKMIDSEGKLIKEEKSR